jgi:hypothetical protein
MFFGVTFSGGMAAPVGAKKNLLAGMAQEADGEHRDGARLR